MKRILFFIMLACTSLFATANASTTDTSTLSLTLVNHSNETMSYAGATLFDPRNNTFSVEPAVILPGATAIITATTTELADLSGSLLFKDNAGKNNTFVIIDKRMFHTGQPLFAIDHLSRTFKSNVTSLTFNRDGKPRALSYIAATVEVTPR
jgi:hypothetical protein